MNQLAIYLLLYFSHLRTVIDVLSFSDKAGSVGVTKGAIPCRWVHCTFSQDHAVIHQGPVVRKLISANPGLKA